MEQVKPFCMEDSEIEYEEEYIFICNEIDYPSLFPLQVTRHLKEEDV